MFRSLYNREAGIRGACQPAGFQQDFGRSLELLHRLKLDKKLEGHEGCVNTVAFTPSAEGLVSGSDDLDIKLWNWQTGALNLSFHSGHRNNVFQARALPHTSDKTIVTCAADGQVRAAFISEDGQAETKKLAKHTGRAHKLALEADQPHCFLSSGEDGAVLSFDLRTRKCTKLLVCKTNRGRGQEPQTRPLGLNSIHCNPARPWQFAVAGGDAYVRVYDRRKAAAASGGDQQEGVEPSPQQTRSYATALATPVRKLAPKHMRDQTGPASHAHVTCANFSRQGEIVATYNDEKIYLFAAEGAPQLHGRPRPSSGSASSPAKRAKIGNSDILADLDDLDEPGSSSAAAAEAVARQASPDQATESSAAAEEAAEAPSGAAIDSWPKSLEDDEVLQSYSGHLNSETVKGVSFMGVADEYVVSGSDCGHVFFWSKADGKLQKLVKGDRHVVNCLEPHPFLPATLATSGIENDIKLWSPTAEQGHPPGREAEDIMSRNISQGTRSSLRVHPMMLSSELIAEILRMQRFPSGRQPRRRAEAAQAGEEECSDQDGGEEAASGEDAEDDDGEARGAAERRQECVIC